MPFLTWIAGGLLLMALAVGGSVWWVAGSQIAPRPALLPDPPSDGWVESVVMPTPQGPAVHGWWMPGEPGQPSVLLLHGLGGHRGAMVERARMLLKHGYSVLLIDLPGHGESPGEAVTFGGRESLGVAAARDWLQRRDPQGAVGVIGVSLGGAAVLLGDPPGGFDAVVLEAVYSRIDRAIENRLAMRLGPMAPWITPGFVGQLQPRLGVAPAALRPVERIGQLGAPVLIVAGGRDQHTPLDESQALYAQAQPPKALWVLPDAAHEDFYAHHPQEYEARVLHFFETFLHKK